MAYVGDKPLDHSTHALYFLVIEILVRIDDELRVGKSGAVEREERGDERKSEINEIAVICFKGGCDKWDAILERNVNRTRSLSTLTYSKSRLSAISQLPTLSSVNMHPIRITF